MYKLSIKYVLESGEREIIIPRRKINPGPFFFAFIVQVDRVTFKLLSFLLFTTLSLQILFIIIVLLLLGTNNLYGAKMWNQCERISMREQDVNYMVTCDGFLPRRQMGCVLLRTLLMRRQSIQNCFSLSDFFPICVIQYSIWKPYSFVV